MSFLFRKNGSSSGRRIKDKLRGRNSDRGKREDEERVRYEGALPPWGILFAEDFVRVDGNVKAVIVDEEGLDVIYWKKLLEIEKEEGIYRGSGSHHEEAFSFHVKNSQSYSGGEVRDESNNNNNTSVDGERYYGKQSQSKFQAPGGGSGGGGPYPPLPLPPGLLAASSSTSSSPLTVNQTSPPSAGAPPPQLAGAPPPQLAGAPPLPIPAKKAPPPPSPPGKKAPGRPPPPPMSKSGPPKRPGNGKGPTKAAESSSAQPKLKPLHWDKVNPDASHSMVWHRIDGGSFNFDGDLMEALFGYVGARKPSEANTVPHQPTVSTTQTYILDPRKSQNKAIVLKSLGMTKEEIIDLLTQGHDPDSDTLEKLSGIAPTPEEQTEITEFNGDPTKLADAESLLFHILRAVPSAFYRFNVMLFKINYGSEVAQQKASLQTLESACNELRARGLFMKLLEAILKAGNRMNAGTARGNAQAFNLTALRKLSDVKSVDGKTTLLHFVVEEVVRSEGKRAAMNKISGGGIADASREEQEIEFIKLGLPIIGGLSSEFTNVKKAAGVDYDSFIATTLALGTRLKETKRLLEQSKGKEDGCLTKLTSFFESAEEELRVITEEQLRIMDLVKKTTNYYQAGALKERNLFQLFVIIRDFLGMVDNACSEIARTQRKQRPAATVAAGASTSTAATPTAPAPQRNAVRFPILPPNFMSEHSRLFGSGFRLWTINLTSTRIYSILDPHSTI
ncbi:formin-like protein 7 isoform X2 [Brassica rapa]|uniref:formin-like protein 7 isoform X2 n=1 Tax=Brassica campestris TaxID=3711 RepID=UPI0004F1C0C6|nr:formin-like protein 7 isoform X2 [Brassica rapa]